MCGIAGIIASEPLDEDGVRAVQRMCDAMSHRGRDGEGIWVSPSHHCILGHRRLIILDPSPAAAQPMRTTGRDLCLTYNGEIYNYLELKRRLEPRCVQFRSSGDTEVALEWLAEHGREGLSAMHGMFALGLWNEHDRSLLLARDPLGIKPMYWATARCNRRRILLFASEVRALLASGYLEDCLSPSGLRGYLAYGSAQAPSTVIEGVVELAPAHSMMVGVDLEPRTKRYWWPSYRANGSSSPGATLDEPLREAISSHLVSDVPLGAFLSGGIDSSAVVSIMAAVARDRVRTLSVAFPDHPGQDESRFARAVAEACGTDHREVCISDAELTPLMRSSLAAMDQPSIDGVNTYIVARAARQSGLTVALSGVGGDELFGGYPSSWDVPYAMRNLTRIGSIGRRALAAAITVAAKAGGASRTLQKLWDLALAEPTIPGIYRIRRRLFNDGQLNELLGGDTCGGNDFEFWEALGKEVQGLSPADAVSWLEMKTYMANTLLRDSDVMGMANSVEIRVPLLHTPFVHAAQQLGAWARSTSPTKKVLIDTCLRALPREIWGRPKQGFVLPIREWVRGALREQVEDTLQSSALPGAKAIWNKFCRNPDRVGWSRPWALFVLETWRRRGGKYTPART